MFGSFVGPLNLAIHTHTQNTRRTHILHVHQPQNRYADTYNTKHTHTPLSQTSKHGALLARAGAAGADFTFHKTTPQSPMSNSHTSNKNSCREYTAPTFSHTTPPYYAAPCVDNLPLMVTLPVGDPLCPALDWTATTPPLPYYGALQRRKMGDQHV
jgi:hypothetical protein